MKENLGGGGRRVECGKTKGKNTLYLRYTFPRALTRCHMHLLCVGFTKRTFIGGQGKSVSVLNSRVKTAQSILFYVVKV